MYLSLCFIPNADTDAIFTIIVPASPVAPKMKNYTIWILLQKEFVEKKHTKNHNLLQGSVLAPGIGNYWAQQP